MSTAVAATKTLDVDALDVNILDQTPIAAGAPEELAGPPHHSTQPVGQTERVSSIDVLRGFSLMGILIMNICSFAGPDWYYLFPLTTVKPVFSGPHWHANTVLWFARWVFAEGKMRGLFSMLFGAGVILLTERAERRGAGVRTADIFTRRNMWLTLFGMLHCLLIWDGDILFFYGATALLFLFPLRHARPKRLLWASVLILLLNSLLFTGKQYFGPLGQKKAADQAYVLRAAHKPLTEEQQDAIRAWEKTEAEWRPDTKKLYKTIAEHQHGYLKAQLADAGDAVRGEALGEYFGFGDWLGMMLLGMALYRYGFLSAQLPARTYAWCAVLGLGIAWPVIFLGCWKAWKHGFDLIDTTRWMGFTYDLGRFAGAVGNAALLLFLIRKGALRWLLARIGNVGQMALSNYLLTSVSMKLVFVWGFWHWYGYVEYYKLYYAVAAMWITNLVFSTLWLRYFRFGPVEWCWRSLTYWKRQPMRLEASGTAVA